MTPAEQIADFVRRHPGEWQPRFPNTNIADMALETVAGWLVLCPHNGLVYVTASRRGPDEPDFCATDEEESLPILTQAAARIADACEAYRVPAEGLPSWLRDPVRAELRRRAGELLTLAGSSPADVVSAAETLDEHLLTRPPVEPTFSGVVNALLEIGMSCRWVSDCADPVEMT